MFPIIILLILLSAGIIYVNQMPRQILAFMNGIPGRIILFTSIIAMYEIAGWVPAALMTLLALLLISSGASAIEGFVSFNKLKNVTQQSEGFIGTVGENFSSDIDIIEKKPGSKWWDEVILGRESIVKTNLVDTYPVQN
jgi:hypothetical protein